MRVPHVSLLHVGSLHLTYAQEAKRCDGPVLQKRRLIGGR